MSDLYDQTDLTNALTTWMFCSADDMGKMRRVLDAVAPAIAARALREAADDPSARLSGHSGVSVRWLRTRADQIERP